MPSLILDTNVYDRLAAAPELAERLRALIEAGEFKVIVTRTIAEELAKSPFGGVPALFPVEYVGNTVARADIMCAGDSLGDGEVYAAHLGQSAKGNDALIVDAASWHADWLVSEDDRLRKRASEIGIKSQVMSYAELAANLKP